MTAPQARAEFDPVENLRKRLRASERRVVHLLAYRETTEAMIARLAQLAGAALGIEAIELVAQIEPGVEADLNARHAAEDAARAKRFSELGSSRRDPDPRDDERRPRIDFSLGLDDVPWLPEVRAAWGTHRRRMGHPDIAHPSRRAELLDLLGPTRAERDQGMAS